MGINFGRLVQVRGEREKTQNEHLKKKIQLQRQEKCSTLRAGKRKKMSTYGLRTKERKERRKKEVSIVKIVSLSPCVEKLKVKKS